MAGFMISLVKPYTLQYLDKTVNLYSKLKEFSFNLEFMTNTVCLCFYPIFNKLQNPPSLAARFVGYAYALTVIMDAVII
jgi:hypothetical protein